MKLSRHVYTRLREKSVHALLGAILFFVLNTVLFVLLIVLVLGNLFSNTGITIYGLITLLLNIGLLIYFGFTRYWIAIGALVVFVIVFLVVLLLAPECFGLDPASANNGTGLPNMMG